MSQARRILATSGSPTEGGWVNRFMLNATTGAVAGAVAGAAASAWRQPPGRTIGGGRMAQMGMSMGLLSKGAILFGTVGAAFAIGESTAEAFTGHPGPVAAGLGGAFAGLVLGIPAKTPQAMAGGALALGASMFIVDIA